MPIPRYPLEEFSRRGLEWYETVIRPQVEDGNFGKRLIIDIETGEYEMSDDDREATMRILSRKPDAQLFGMRIGYPAMSKRGGAWNVKRKTENTV